ncbi:ensconsin-like [Dreissena polymorpha]|uniref:ensconsin-like n=1 Tax=Dreissena polymorpha TaxID=45954 RepID=UPI0022652C3E|nr:ensconsin-like [Dreissena polymorpha]
MRPAPAAIQPVVTTPAPTVQPTMTTSHATPVQQQIVSHPQPVTHPTSTPQSSTLPQTTTTPQPAAWIPTGTPVIDINPRHRLIMEQEFDFAVSLAADQDREAARQTARVRRNLARTERQRLRDQRKEEQETMQTNAVEEIANSRHNTAPEDMLSVILVLPDQQELNKTFSKDTLSEV